MAGKIPLTGIVLAGGEGRRMNGQDKGWIDIDGLPLIERVLARLQPQVEHCVISANRNLERYSRLGLPVVSDDEVYLGPLAGIGKALSTITTDYALIVPTDAPLLPLDLGEQLRNGLPAPLVLCHDGERLQPLFGLYHRDLATSIQQFLHSGKRKLTDWCMAQQPHIVTIRNTDAFSNLNSAEELQRVSTLLQKQQP